MNASITEWIQAVDELEKTLEETDINQMMVDMYLSDLEWIRKISEYTIRKWLHYPITSQDNYGELYIYYFYRICEKHEKTSIFYTLLSEDCYDEFYDWMQKHGYQEVICRMLDENRPETPQEGLRL